MPLAAPVSTPPLLEGDSLTSDEFLRRWEDLPDLKHAELIDGIVYMSSPVSRDHGDPHLFLANWLGFYSMATPGCRASMEPTWVMGERQVPQPDVTLRILTEYGGQSGIAGEYAAASPELIVEVAVSSYSRDFGAKRRLYERMGVREYIIAAPCDEKLVGLSLTSHVFQPLESDDDDILRSAYFPGLWLDIKSLWGLDLQRMNSVLQRGLATPEHAAFAEKLASQKH